MMRSCKSDITSCRMCGRTIVENVYIYEDNRGRKHIINDRRNGLCFDCIDDDSSFKSEFVREIDGKQLKLNDFKVDGFVLPELA